MGQKITVSLALDVEKDRDILRWLDRLKKGDRSEAIREAIRGEMGRGGVTLGDVYRVVKAVERKLEVGGWRLEVGEVESKEGEWEEPERAAAALDALGQV